MDAQLSAGFMRPREKFPHNLRLLRISRGFARARHFAEAIGIGENRYTRYERGEAEPNIDLIYKICDVLKAAPNDLFGIDDGPSPARPGFAEVAHAAPVAPVTSRDRQTAGWALARRLASLDRSDPQASAATRLKATAAIFLELEKSPFHAIARILSGPSASTASAEELRDVDDLVDEYLSHVGSVQSG